MSNVTTIPLYRMTHIENLPHILQYGITHRNSPIRNDHYASIGDGSLISVRTSFPTPTGKLLGDYTPFYFGPRMPMLYVIQKGYNGVNPVPAADIVYCVTSVGRIIDEGLDFAFTDGHAVDILTEFFGPNRVAEMNQLLDWRAINARYWRNDADLDLKRKKEAEFLVLGDLPITAVERFIVYNAEARERIHRIHSFNNQSVIVNSNCYF